MSSGFISDDKDEKIEFDPVIAFKEILEVLREIKIENRRIVFALEKWHNDFFEMKKYDERFDD